MPDVIFQKATGYTVPSGGCSFAGVTCMGGGAMLAMFYNALQEHWVFTSDDNGETWTEVLTQHASDENTWRYAALATGTNTVLVGNGGPASDGPTDDDAVVRTTDGGLTWAGAVASGIFASGDFWDMFGFVALDNDEVWALGEFTSNGGADQSILKSTDGGASFTEIAELPAPSAGTLQGATCGVYLGDDTIVLGTQMSGAGGKPRVYRTTDRGDNWTEIVLDDSQYSNTTAGRVNGIADLGNDVLIATGQQSMGAGSFPPKTWRSTDAGATWTEITDSLPDWTLGAQTEGRAVVRLADDVAVLAMNGRPDRVGDSHWRLTTDAGVTWTTCTAGGYTEADTVFVTINEMAVADNGTIAVTLQSGPGNEDREIWYGTLDDLTGAGPCVDFDEETVGTLSVPSSLVCVPSFIPPFCPPECPPASTPTLATPPAVATQAGYASILPILGLMLGGATVAVSVPAGCGPAFTSEPCDRVEIT